MSRTPSIRKIEGIRCRHSWNQYRYSCFNFVEPIEVEVKRDLTKRGGIILKFHKPYSYYVARIIWNNYGKGGRGAVNIRDEQLLSYIFEFDSTILYCEAHKALARLKK